MGRVLFWALPPVAGRLYDVSVTSYLLSNEGGCSKEYVLDRSSHQWLLLSGAIPLTPG